MKVFVKDSKLRRHSVDVDEGASVAHLKLLLANMSLVPAGFVPNLVYQARNLSDGDCVGSIGYSPDLSISLVCVKAAPASAAAGQQLQSSQPSDAKPPAAAQTAPASRAAAAGGAAAHAAARPLTEPSFSSSAASPCAPLVTPSSAAVPLREGSRVRIEGLQAKPEMNGRTGVVRGALNAQSGRWTVEVAADEVGPANVGSFRPANLSVIDVCTSSAPPSPAFNVATEWLDELGCVCPKAVDYASQCPKGHALLTFAGGGCGASAQRVMCRICHILAESKQAAQWLVCSVAGCCAGYAVCDGCVSALYQAPAAVTAGEGFSSQVNRAAGAALVLWLTSAATGRLAAVLAVGVRAAWRVAWSPDDVAVREDVPAAPNVAAAEQRGG